MDGALNGMNAEPLLSQVAALLKKRRLSAVLIGNAAAALQGSPVTTMDLDFMFRKTPGNLKLDFMSKVDGIRSFESLVEQIRRQSALPPERRTNFLRKRLPGGGSAL